MIDNMFSIQESLCKRGACEALPLGSICSIKTGQNISKDYITQHHGQYPVINSGRSPLGYVDTFNTEDDPIGIASRGSVGLVTWTDGRFYRGNLNYSCTVNDRNQVNPRYLYHYLLYADSDIQALATHQGIPALNASALKTLVVPVPTMAYQNYVVRILDTFTELTNELTRELTRELNMRKKQYEYYRDRLLSFNNEDVEFLPIGSICVIKTGQSISKEYIAKHLGHYPVLNSGRFPLGYVDTFNTEDDPIGIASRGSVGLVTWTDGRFYRGNLNYSCTVNDRNQVNPRYLYHYLLYADSDIQALATHQGIPALNASALKTLVVPVPAINQQNHIVDVLDKFDTLTQSMADGLPREIQLRRKQYEYYRDKLLNFKNSNS